jgi:hypothetical protein
VKGIEGEWQDKCDRIIQKMQALRVFNDDTRLQINRAVDSISKEDAETNVLAKEAVEKIKTAARRDYLYKIDQL